MKKITLYIALICFIVTAHAADYDNVSKGDRYYIHHVFDDDDYVEVVTKLSGDQIKVRDMYSGATKIVYASKLLTESELENRNTATEIGMGAAALGLVYCFSNPNNCK